MEVVSPAECLPTKARSKGLGITYLAIYIALVSTHVIIIMFSLSPC